MRESEYTVLQIRHARYSGFGASGLSHRRLTDDWRRSFEKVDRFKTCEKMAEEQMRQLAERIAALEAELRATQQANAELTQGLTEQREIAETAQLRADRRGRAQMQDFAQMTAEIVAARGPEGQGERRFGVKMERPDYFDGGKLQDVDTWLFQVREHLNMVMMPDAATVPYAASLFRGNAALWWRERCENALRPANWHEFAAALREQFRPENWSRRGRDELATMYQYAKESVADFLHRFRATCLKIEHLSEEEKLDRFVRALVNDVRLQVELRNPATFNDAALYAERADAVLARTAGHSFRHNWQQKKNKGGYRPPPAPAATSGETSTGTGPEPMEIGSMRRKPLTQEEMNKLRAQKACFFCRKPNAGHMARNCPEKTKKQGNDRKH